VFEPEQLLFVPQGAFSDFDTLRDRLIAKVDQAFGSGDDEAQTVAVDVIGFSMGGIISRYAAMPIEGKRRLNIRRLYTISSPHRGAAWATIFSPDSLVRDMHADSAFLAGLDEVLPTADYELTCYVRLGDHVVGPQNAAPEGVPLWWVPSDPFTESHMDAAKDPRIVADIARRLRGEMPMSEIVPTPLPD
jgi:pimeloyl-ACP methyl ester carboxylesterase